jgi:glutamate--cysteine ligase
MSVAVPDTAETRATIEDKQQLVRYLENGCKPKQDWRIGTEHEKFAFLTDTLEPVPYFGERSIKALLDGMAERFGWQPAMEGEHIIGLTDPVTGGNVSLEPGGQFELSGAPLENIFQTCQEVHEHLMQVREVGDELGIGFLGWASTRCGSSMTFRSCPRAATRSCASTWPRRATSAVT